MFPIGSILKMNESEPGGVWPLKGEECVRLIAIAPNWGIVVVPSKIRGYCSETGRRIPLDGANSTNWTIAFD